MGHSILGKPVKSTAPPAEAVKVHIVTIEVYDTDFVSLYSFAPLADKSILTDSTEGVLRSILVFLRSNYDNRGRGRVGLDTD